LGGVDISTFLPSTFIAFVPDSPQFIVGSADTSFLTSNNNSFVTIATSSQTYTALGNPINAVPSTQVAFTLTEYVPPL